LKTSFNRPLDQGGFWDPKNEWYVYWRDRDGSIHGNNLVTPVNFAAIAYGLCDDPGRQRAILDRMESEMQREHLFTWPLNFFPYQREEGADGNFPYPRYENGDLFLSWDEVGIRAYAKQNPAVALKYIRSALDRYEKDGLSFQRYLRQSQSGAGDDILAGNCMPIVGLYRDIYGLQPKPNRLYLEPHLTRELDGAEIRYPLRGQLYVLKPGAEECSVTAGACTLRAATPFAVNAIQNGLEYFSGTNGNATFTISRPNGAPLTVEILSWPEDPALPRRWTESSSQAGSKTVHVIAQLQPDALYELKANGRLLDSARSDHAGRAEFAYKRGSASPQTLELMLKQSP